MELKKITRNDISELKDKKIICYMMVKDYLRQIDVEYGVLDQIECVVDEFKRNWGVCEYDETHSYQVYSTDKLRKINWETHILLVTSEIYWIRYENIKTLKLDGLDTVFYYEDIDTKYYRQYLEKYKNTELKNKIIFRSGMRAIKRFPYADFANNAKALFEYMLEQGYNESYELVWIVGEPNQFKEYYDTNNVILIGDEWSHSTNEREREAYYSNICLGKYFFFTENSSFIRFPREGQIRTQLWHGNGFKARSYYESCAHECEYAIVTSRVTAETHKSEFFYREDQIKITGLPKQDWILHPISQNEWDDFGILKGEKTIFWLPTVRDTGFNLIVDNDTIHSESGLPILYSSTLMKKFDQFLKRRNIVLVVKLHPEQKNLPFMEEKFTNICWISNKDLFERRLDINRILDYADALVSDYSSVATDYLLLDRPIAFAVGDLEEFTNRRGFVFDPIEDWLPGELIYSYEDFEKFVCEVAEGRDESAKKRRMIAEKMLAYRDDQSCKRVLEAVGLS